MTDVKRVAFIGNSLPRRCGIATFTTDLQQAVAKARPDIETTIVAMTDHGQVYDYPASVGFQIRDDRPEDYLRAAEFLNSGAFDAVSLQHEFGIFGGEAGSALLPLLSRLAMPIVTTLHTVLAEPSDMQLHVMTRVIDASSRVVVMARKGRSLLMDTYGVSPDKIDIIPHGIPDYPFVEPDRAKETLGYAGRSVILTFGLLSPNKGIEFMIDAMPAILKRRPDAVYVVLGATHPNLVRERGEAYRESLVARVRNLGIEAHVVFLDHFVDKATLLGFISMCDVYVTPYLTEAQMTSGTLAYSFGLGKAVVSTPYWHAAELLADGKGVLVPFGDSAALGESVGTLLTNTQQRLALRRLAYDSSRSMTWSQTADRYVDLFSHANRGHRLRLIRGTGSAVAGITHIEPPAMRTSYLESMCDDTGLFQHAVYSIPDRHHGYCVDDNARALLVACALYSPGEQPLAENLTNRFCAFIQHAWNLDLRHFRNFMGFDRRWLEDRGSEDSHGRTVWALGDCALRGQRQSRMTWAVDLFSQALPVMETFTSPRALAFALLGLDGYCVAVPDDVRAVRIRLAFADRLMKLLAATESAGWIWFEDVLAYDNARLPQALILTGRATGTRSYVDAGVRTLQWLTNLQTSPEGRFRPVGTESFGLRRALPRQFDQQPVEAAAMIAACVAAWRSDGSDHWLLEALRVFAWFTGTNDLGVALVDADNGSCRDGLHPDRANENRGAESVVSYLLALADMRQIARVLNERPAARHMALHA